MLFEATLVETSRLPDGQQGPGTETIEATTKAFAPKLEAHRSIKCATRPPRANEMTKSLALSKRSACDSHDSAGVDAKINNVIIDMLDFVNITLFNAILLLGPASPKMSSLYLSHTPNSTIRSLER